MIFERLARKGRSSFGKIITHSEVSMIESIYGQNGKVVLSPSGTLLKKVMKKLAKKSNSRTKEKETTSFCCDTKKDQCTQSPTITTESNGSQILCGTLRT